MKIRTLIAALSLIVAVPVMHAADADVAATIAAQVKANPDNAAQIVADAIKANPSLAPDIAAAAVKAAPGKAKAITTAAIKAAPDQILAIARAETKAVPAQGHNIYSASIAEVTASGNVSPGVVSGLNVILVQSIVSGIAPGTTDLDLGEKVSATVSSPAS